MDSLALLEIENLTPALLAADVCAKSAGVHLLGVENTLGTAQCLKLTGSTGDVAHAAEQARIAAERMGSRTTLSVMPAPLEITASLASAQPVYSALLDTYDDRVPRDDSMNTPDAIGLLETQGLVAALHATDDMLKASNVTVVGKEKIGAAYVTIVVRGDVAAVQTAIETGRQTVERLGGTLIMADVIARPHPELVALLPA